MNEKVLNEPFDIASVAAAMQRGPRPLPVHIFSAIQDSFITSQKDVPAKARLHKMVEGMQLYMCQEYQRDSEEKTLVWRSGETSLYRAGGNNSDLKAGERNSGKSQAVLLIPSLINKSTILDLLPERSLLQYLEEQGFAVYLLDWGLPVHDPGCSDLSGIIRRITEVVNAVTSHSELPVSAFGYCMGGTLLMRALLDNDLGAELASKLSRVIFMAAPWDFEAEPADLTRHVRIGAPAALQIIEDKKYLPVNWIQGVFATVTAEKIVEKYVRFASLDQNSDKARLFTAVEDWLNDGIDLPAAIAQTCIQDWYGRNATADMAIESPLPVPALIVASQRDVLVPHASSMAIVPYFSQADVLEPDTGHIGMITADRAVTEVWKPMSSWLSLLSK